MGRMVANGAKGLRLLVMHSCMKKVLNNTYINPHFNHMIFFRFHKIKEYNYLIFPFLKR